MREELSQNADAHKFAYDILCIAVADVGGGSRLPVSTANNQGPEFGGRSSVRVYLVEPTHRIISHVCVIHVMFACVYDTLGALHVISFNIPRLTSINDVNAHHAL